MVRRSFTRTSKTPTRKRLPAARKRRETKPELSTKIFFLLDASGSMQPLREDAIASFNTFVKDQREFEGRTDLSLIFFDTGIRTVHENTDIERVPELNWYTYNPNGGTALYDAVGRTITSNLLRPASKRETEKVIVAIFTDGEENASKEFTYSRVAELIGLAQEEHGWEILFLGSSMRSVEVARNMGIKVTNTVYVEPTWQGLQGAVKSMGYATRAFRGDTLTGTASGAMYSANSVDMQSMYTDALSGKGVTSSTTGTIGSSTISDLKAAPPTKKTDEKK